MPTVEQFFQPPLTWQQFETLTCETFKRVYSSTDAQPHGRTGQPQTGVDVFGSTGPGAYGPPRRIGVQCKQTTHRGRKGERLAGGPVTEKMLEDEAVKSDAFSVPLDQFILATTARRDGKIQRFAARLSDRRQTAGLSAVLVWSWDEFVTFINQHHDLQKFYYENIIDIRSQRDQDRLIVELIVTAFDRPAFTDRLDIEHVEDFTVALADTRAAMNLGRLVDRRSRHVIRTTIAGWRGVEEPRWRAELEELNKELSTLRETLAQGLKDGSLSQKNGYLDIINPVTGSLLFDARDRCVRRVRDLQQMAGVQPL